MKKCERKDDKGNDKKRISPPFLYSVYYANKQLKNYFNNFYGKWLHVVKSGIIII
jgi:hypothetical protein